MSEISQVQAIYRAAMHRIAAKASEYEAKDNGQGRVLRQLVEESMADADRQAKELLSHVKKLRPRQSSAA